MSAMHEVLWPSGSSTRLQDLEHQLSHLAFVNMHTKVGIDETQHRL